MSLLRLNQDCFCLISYLLDLNEILVVSSACKEFEYFGWSILINRPSVGTPYWRDEKNQFKFPPLIHHLWERRDEHYCFDTELMHYKDALQKLQFKNVVNLFVDIPYHQYAHRNLVQSDEIEQLIINLFPNLKRLKVKRRHRGRFFAAQLNKSINYHFCDQRDILRMIDYLTEKRIELFDSLASVTCASPICQWDPQSMAWRRKNKLVDGWTILLDSEQVENVHAFVIICRYFFINVIRVKRDRRFKTKLYRRLLGIERFCEFKLWLKPVYRLWFNKKSETIEKLDELEPKDFCEDLEELYYLNAEDDRHQKKLLKFVYYCRKLEFFDISGSNFTIDFVKQVMKIFDYNIDRKTLELCCYNTCITCEDLESLDYFPPRLRISLINSYPRNYPRCCCYIHNPPPPPEPVNLPNPENLPNMPDLPNPPNLPNLPILLNLPDLPNSPSPPL